MSSQFLLKRYAEDKIVQTSFLDESFRKNLESAIRFGQPLLIQDVEHYDPILNSVLNNEVRKTGGRVLITIGDQDIDLSPTWVGVGSIVFNRRLFTTNFSLFYNSQSLIGKKN